MADTNSMDTKLKSTLQADLGITDSVNWSAQNSSEETSKNVSLFKKKFYLGDGTSSRNNAIRCSLNDQRGTKRRNLYAVASYDRRIQDRRDKQIKR